MNSERKISLSNMLSIANELDCQSDQLNGMGFRKEPTNAYEAALISEAHSKVQRQLLEKVSEQRTGVKAQIEAAKSLQEQAEQLEALQQVMEALLRHSLEQSKQQVFAQQERERVDAERHRENTRFSKIAALTGILSLVAPVVIAVVRYLLRFF